MPRAVEIGLRIGDGKGLDVTLKRLGGGGEAADMRVDPGNQQLIAPPRPHQIGEIGPLERAVAVLLQHDVAGLRGQLRQDRLMFGARGHARSPQIGLKPSVRAELVALLRGMEDRQGGGAGGLQQRGDMRDHPRQGRAVAATPRRIVIDNFKAAIDTSVPSCANSIHGL